MSARFLPTQESRLDAWMLHFNATISADPALYGLSEIDAAEVALRVSAWHAAFLAAAAPGTRTRATVHAKREAKAAAGRVVRAAAARVRANRAVADDLKIDLGLIVRGAGRPLVPTPPAAPVLSLTRMLPGLMSMRASAGRGEAPGGGGDARGKPPRVAGVLVFRAVGDAPALRPEEARFLTLTSRTTFESTFSPADRGKIATYFARWTNGKGEGGPWSEGLSVPIAA